MRYVRLALVIQFFALALVSANAQVLNFGSVSVGTAAPSQTITYSLSGSIKTSALNVLTVGVAGLDYTQGTSSCTVGVAHRMSCTLSIAFTPSAPGLRYGAVTLYVNGGNQPLLTWYLTGIGQSGAVTIDPGTQSTIATLSNSTQAYGSTIDGAGNVYVVDHANSQVIELAAGTFTQSIVVAPGSGLSGPTALALDGAGNLYISDTEDGQIVVVPNEQGTLNSADMTQLSIAGLGSPRGLATDGSGNLYIADAANGDVIEVPLGGGTPTTVASNITNPAGIALDAAGNVYVASSNSVSEYQPPFTGAPISIGSGYSNPRGIAVDASGAVYVADTGNSQIVWVAPGGASQTTFPATGISNPQGLALDAADNVYITDTGNVYQVNRTQTVALTFASTFVGSTSGPLTLTVSDAGNQLMSVSNLAIAGSFTQVPSGGTDCNASTQLSSAGQCLIAVTFSPTISGGLTGTIALTDNALNVSGTTQTVQLSGTGSQVAQTITFPTIPTQTYGGGSVTLSASDSSGLPVSYKVISGPATVSGNVLTITGAGSVIVQACQTGNTEYAAATPVQQTFTVNPAPTTVIWSNPAAITYGTILSASQLDATTNPACAGTYVYTPAAGTVLNAGSQTLSVLFTPSNTNYAPSTATVTLQVNPASTTVAWSAPAAITYGTALSASQLNATTNPACAGSYVYTPAAGTVLNAGSQTLSVLFTPSNANYAPSTGSVTLQVNPAPTTVAWSAPAAITYGTALSASQLNATTNPACAGSYVYTPAAGTVLNAGSQTLSVLFTPSNANYAPSTATVTLQVNPAPTTVAWSAPAAITYGTALSASQLDATTTPACAGAYAYTPATGTVLNAGSQTLSVKFTPSNTNYASSTASVTLQVNPAATTVAWSNPAAITYGTMLSGAQLDATATPTGAGTYVYTPAIGTVLNAGSQTLSVKFTPSNTNYASSTGSVTLQVNQATPTVNWSNPTAITYGTALSATQLDATATPVNAGNFVYTPPAGTVLNGGSQTLSVTFTPTNANYGPSTGSATLQVNQASQTVKFTTAAPSQATYNTSFTVAATATSGLPVSYSSSGPCTNLGATYTMGNTAGNCKVMAAQSGSGNYLAATTVTEYTAATSLLAPTVTFTGAPATDPYQSTFTVASTTNAGVTPTLAATGSCTISGTTVTITLGSGTCTMTASWAATGTYQAASATQTTTATKAAPTVTFTGAFSTAPYQSTFTVVATTNSGVSPTLTAMSACSISGTTVTMTSSTGTCTTTANWATNIYYLAASLTQTTSAEQAASVIAWNTPATITYPAKLSAAQLDAAANVPGKFVYTPASGTILYPGDQTLSTQFTPTSSNFAAASATVALVVNDPSNCTPTYEPGASGPPTYGGLRNDPCVSEIGTIPGLWANFATDYGFTGAGTLATNSMGVQILRVTDGNSDPAHPGGSYMNNYSGGDGDQHWANDHSMFIVGRNGALVSYVYAFNGSTMQATQLQYGGKPFTLPSSLAAFGQTSANVHKVWIIGTSTNCKTTGPCAIQQYDLTACILGGTQGPTACNPPTPTTVYDFQQGAVGVAGANCLAGLDVTWFGDFRVSDDDTLFTMGFSNAGLQGTGTIVAGYLVGSGCRVWNTGTSTLNLGPTVGGIPGGDVVGEFPTGATTPQPMTMTGCSTGYNCPGGTDQFTLHGADGIAADNLIHISGTKCLAGSCTLSSTVNNDSPYIWNFPTLQSFSMGGSGPQLSGHECYGYNSLVYGSNSPQGQDAFIGLVGPGDLFTPSTVPSGGNSLNLIAAADLAAPNSLNLDTHCSWNADNLTDTMPILQSSTTVCLGNQGSQLTNQCTPTNNKPYNGCVIPADITSSTWPTSGPNCGTAANRFLGPYVNEVDLYQTNVTPGNTTAGSACVTTNGSSNTLYSTGATSCTSNPPIRLGNSGISALNPIFNAQNATIDWSPDGLFYTVTTDWWCTFGASTSGQDTICGGVEWQASTSYSVGDIITPSAGNTVANCTYTASGTAPLVSGSTEPTGWGTLTGGVCPAQIPATGLDGNITWIRVGSIGKQNARSDVIVGSTSIN
jgi:sugar lactone lactonase YvrE